MKEIRDKAGKFVRLSNRERIERELAGEPTGFDVLVQKKQDNLWKLYDFLKKNPNATSEEIRRVLKVSSRTVTRYLTALRKRFGHKFKLVFMSQAEKQIKEREKRVKRMNAILKRNPDITSVELAKKLNISLRTLRSYREKE